MTNKYLTKIAQLLSDENKKDIADTGTIAALGTAGSLAADQVVGGIHKARAARAAARGAANSPGRSKWIVGGVGGAIGLGADYAGLKINKAMDTFRNRNNNNDSIT